MREMSFGLMLLMIPAVFVGIGAAVVVDTFLSHLAALVFSLSQ